MATAQELFNLYTQRIANSDSNGVSAQKQAEAAQKAEAKKDRLSPYQLVTANAFAPETISEEQKVELDPLAYLRTYGLDDFNKHNAALADASRELFTDLSMERSTLEAAADTAIGVGSGAANTVAGVGVLGLAAADAVTGSRIAPKAVDLLNRANEKVESLKSASLQGNTRSVHALQEAMSQNADREYLAKLDNGENTTVAKLERIGKGILNAVNSATSNSAYLGYLVAEGVGSIAAISPLSTGTAAIAQGFKGVGKATASLVEKNIAKGMTKEAAELAAKESITNIRNAAATVNIGLTEAGGAYQQASTEAAEILAKRTDLTDQQKTDLRNRVGLLAAAITFPGAIAAGKLVAPFEAAPFAPKTLKNLTRQMGYETVEEGIQSATSQVASNIGISGSRVDPTKEWHEGVGEAIGEGALAGGLAAGVIGAPGVAKNAVGSAGKAAASIATGIANNRDAAKDSEAISVVNGSSESALEQINASADISTEAKEASKQVIEQTQNIPTEVLSKTKEGSTVQQIVKANGTDIIATMKALTDIIKNSKDIANDTDAHEAIAAAQIIQGKVAALGQQLEKAGFEGNEELTKYYQAMERIFSRTQQLAGDEKVLTKLNEIRDSLHEKLSTDASKVSQQELGILADTVLNDIAGAIESGVDLDNLISAMVPMESGDDRKINALQTAKAAVKALEDALGTNWYGSVKHAIAAENVSRSTRSVFIALNDHLQQLLNETKSGIDPTASIISLGKFAQGQMNKLAAIEFSSNQGSNRNVLPITYGRSTNKFKSSPGESVGAGKTDKQKEFMRQIAAEVNVAKSLYDVLKDKASIKLPELDAEGAIWEDDNSFSKIAYDTTTVAGKDGKSTFDAYNQVYDDGSPNLIRKKSSGPKVERKVGFNLSIKESKHHQKDEAKAKLATHFIGDGAEGSSTDIYRNDAESQGIPTNKKEGYTKDSVVFVSMNGNRKNRKGIETIVDSLKAAIEAGATIVTDTEENANRSYNIGEREVADFLKNNGYTYKKSNNIGVWTKAEIKEETEEAAKDETGETTKETETETETEEVTTGKAKELTKAEIINNIQNALKNSDITALVDSVISLSKVVSPKVAVAIGSYISSGMGVNTEREFSLGQERHNLYIEELRNKNPELSKVLDDFLKERDFSKILRGKEPKADGIFADDDTAFKEYFSTMVEIINGNETQEYVNNILAIIKEGVVTTAHGNRVIKINGKKLLKNVIDNSSSKLMPIWRLVYKLTPDNIPTYIGAFQTPFTKHIDEHPIFFSPLVNTSGKSRFIDPKTLVHEFFHNVTLTNGDSEYWEALKGLKEPLKKILDEFHEDSFLHMYIKYAASNERELGAVLATEAVYGAVTNVLETKHTKELADKFKDILGKFIQAGISLFIRKSKDATESNIADLANAAFVDLAQRILTKDEVNKILENQEQQTTTSTTKVEPIVESISPESHKEIQNELTTTIGSSVDSSIRDTLLSWITFGEGNSVFMSAVNDIATVLPKIQKELDKLLGSEKVSFNINTIVKLLADKLNTRAKQWHTNASDTVKSNFNNRVSALKNGNVARIFPQDYSNLWTNSENGFGTHLANAMALVGIRWIMSPSKEQKVSTSFLASHLEGRLGEGLSKNDIPGSILNRFNGFFMEAGAVDTLNTLFQDVTGLRKKTKDNLPVSTEGLLDSVGTNIFISMVDAGMIIPYVATWNDSKSNYDIVPYTSTNQLGDGSFIVYKYNKAVDQTLVNNVTKVLDNIFDVAAANNGVVYTTENELPPVQKKQIKSKIGISKSQTEIIKKANSIIFRLNKGVQALYNALGFKKLDYLFGSKINDDIHEMYKNKLINRQHYESLKGKQQSVYSAFNSFLEYVALAKGKDESFGFRFAHAISKVHRLQQQGSLTTPQADKLIRALMAPGEAELDPTNDEHKELFYKAMAQAFGIKIAEDYDWKDKLNKMMATEEFSQAIELIKKYTKVDETAVSNAPPLDDSTAAIDVSKIKAVNKEQEKAIKDVQDFLNSNETFHVVTGKAGTGKTTIMQLALREIIINEPDNIIISAYSHKAKGVLEGKLNNYAKALGIDTTIRAMSVTRLLGKVVDIKSKTGQSKLAKQEPIKTAKYIIIDEASMLSNTELKDIKKHLKKGQKVIFLGDSGQLGPISNSKSGVPPVFSQGFNESRLVERVRQGEDSSILPYADYYWNNVHNTNGQEYNPIPDSIRSNTNELEFIDSVPSAVSGLLHLFKQAVDTENHNLIKIVSFNNLIGPGDNKNLLRGLLQVIRTSALGLELGTPINEYEKRELVITNNNSTAYKIIKENDKGEPLLSKKKVGIANSEEFVIDNVSEPLKDKRDNTYFNITLRNSDGEKYLVKVLDNVSFEKELRERDRLKNRYHNDSISYAEQNRLLEELTKQDEYVESYTHLLHNHIISAHKSQGSTYQNVIIDENSFFNKYATPEGASRGLYTAITRASQKVIIAGNSPYTNKNSTVIEQPTTNLDTVYDYADVLDGNEDSDTDVHSAYEEYAEQNETAVDTKTESKPTPTPAKVSKESNELDILKPFLEEGPVGLLALHEYVKWLEAEKEGSKFKTTLPVEIDGKTNGPAGVMYMLNTVFNGSWFQNLTRVGVELGAKGAVSLMDLFNKTGTKLDDSYRHTANLLNKAIKEAKTEIKNNQNVIIDLVKRKNNLTKDDKDTVGLFKRTYLFSVMGRISPEIEVDENGDLIFGRSFVKNPITVTLYGSGDAGIAQKILGAMEELLYQKATEALQSGDPEVIAATKKELSKILNDINLATSFFMINKDGDAKLVIKNTNTTVNDLFEFSIPSVLRKAFHEELTNNFVTRFLHTSIAKSVSESAINNTKQLATLASTLAALAGIQYNRRIKALYELKLKEAGLTLEDKIPYINILSRNDFEKIYNETIGVNPLLELEYGSLDATTKDMTSSDDTAGAKSIASTRGASTVQLAISAKLKLPQVGNPGVKAIPYSIIGGGDSATVIGAMATDSYEKTLAIFDGHDAQLDVAKNIGNAVNEANINAWSQNLYIVYRELLENTDAFFNVDNATAEELAGFSYALTETLYTRKEFNNLIAAIQNGNTQAREELISAVKDYLKTTTNSLNHKAALTEAKNNVIQRIGISSDQYSGTGSPYFKEGEEAGDFASLSNEEKVNVFNDMLAEEVNKINGANVTDTQISAQEFLKNLIKNKLTNANDRRLATGLLSLLGSTDLDIVITEDENTNAVQGPSKIFHNKESTKEILSNIIDRVIEDKLINIVLGSLNGTDQEQMANRMGYARLEAILTNLDQINISSIASPEAAFIINNFINDLKDIMGVTPSSLGGESITLKEAWEQLNKEMNEASPDTLGELQSRVANTMAHMIREILSEPTIRAIYGSLESVGSKPEMVSKDIKNQMKEIDSIFPKSDKAARTVINRLRKLFHITIKSIFGEDLYKRVFSIKNDVEYSVQLMTYVEPKNVKKPEPTKPKIKNKNKPSEVSAMVPLPSSMSADEKASEVLKHVLTKYPSLAPKGQATTEQIAKLSTLSNKVMQMVDNLPQELRAADFNYNSQEMDRLTETVLQHMIMLPHEPAKLAEIQKIYDSFMDKVEIYHLDKFGIGQLKFEFLKNGAKQYTNLDGNQVRLAIFAGMVQNDPDLAKLVDQLVTTEVKKVTNIDEFLRNKNDQFWDWFNNKFFLEGKGKLLPSEIVKELIKVKDKNIDDQSYYEQLGSKYNNIISSIDNKIANAIERTGEKLSESQSPAVALFGQALDRKSHASIARGITRLTNTLPFGDAIRSLARDVLNQDNFMDAYAKLNKQAKNIYQSMRNSIKNDLPVDIVSSFENKLNNEEWKLLTDTLGSMDIGLFKADTAKSYIINKSRRAKRIKEIESILSNSHPVGWNDVQKKAKQLSSFMNTKIAGELLLPNAYAVGELATGTFIKRSDQYISDLDELITLYALEDMSNTNAAKLTKLIQDNPSGFNALISVMGGIRAGEHTFLNVRNKYNFRKDYLRQQLELGSDIKVENEKNGKFLLERGYTKVAEFSPPGSNEKLSYYFAPVTGKNAFSQGALQVVRYTAFGIDSITGEPRGNINGGIVRDAKEIARLIKSKNLTKEGYRPLFNHKGEIIALERLIDTDKVAKANFEKNLPILLGSQLARQYEEVGADNINNALIEKTFDHWNAEKISHKDEYINVLDSSQLSRTQQDALSLVPPHLKEVAESYFGKGVWMVRKDAVDVVFGHRMAGIGDFQSGISNWSPETQKLIRNAMVELLGEKGVAIALKGEEFWKNLATDAKDMIVIKSIIIPAFNALSNIIHLSMVGIPFAVIPNKIKYFVNEANILSDSLNREKHLRMELLKYSNEPAKVEVILSRIESLEEARKKLKIYPLYENGEFGSIEDVAEVNNLKSLKSDSVVSFLNEKLDQLPDTPKHVLKNVLLTKDSATYQFMRKFTMYGDFIARAIEYEYLLNNGVSKEEIDRRVKNEFVDYDSPLGRNRAWSESMGLTMFWNYKLRIMKSATRIAFDNPFRAVMLSLSPIDTPIKDNIFGELISGTLGYSIGPGMVARSAMMHPVLASTL